MAALTASQFSISHMTFRALKYVWMGSPQRGWGREGVGREEARGVGRERGKEGGREEGREGGREGGEGGREGGGPTVQKDIKG